MLFVYLLSSSSEISQKSLVIDPALLTVVILGEWSSGGFILYCPWFTFVHCIITFVIRWKKTLTS